MYLVHVDGPCVVLLNDALLAFLFLENLVFCIAAFFFFFELHYCFISSKIMLVYVC